MCGRYALVPGSVRWDQVAAELDQDIAVAIAGEPPRANIAPTSTVPIIVHDEAGGGARLAHARWQFIPRWWKDTAPPRFSTINARSEEAAGKPLWRDAWRHGRCLVPATHWIEWQQAPAGKQPFALQAAGGSGFLFAGLAASRADAPQDAAGRSFAILTRAAPAQLRALHDRMPAIVAARGWNAWLDPTLADADAVAATLAAHAVTTASHWPISTRINSPRNQEPELLQPVTAP